MKEGNGHFCWGRGGAHSLAAPYLSVRPTDCCKLELASMPMHMKTMDSGMTTRASGEEDPSERGEKFLSDGGKYDRKLPQQYRVPSDRCVRKPPATARYGKEDMAAASAPPLLDSAPSEEGCSKAAEDDEESAPEEESALSGCAPDNSGDEGLSGGAPGVDFSTGFPSGLKDPQAR